MTDALMDRIKAHRMAPDVYDPPTFDQMADRIEETQAKLTNAVEALRCLEIAATGAGVHHPQERKILHEQIALTRAALAELEGK